MLPNTNIIDVSNVKLTDHIRHLAEKVVSQQPRAIPGRLVALLLFGPEPFSLAL